jgi:septum formation protein
MLFLASRSPRRVELLRQLGFDFEQLDIDVPEQQGSDELADDYVRRVAREKAGAGLLAVAGVPNAVVIAADTEVVLEQRVFGKPRDENDAHTMLTALSGRAHRALSAVSVLSAAREASRLSSTEVHFAPLDQAQLDAYLASKEWCGRAGAYAIQGRAAAFITRIDGSYSGVMGLPLHETAQLLREFGLRPQIP